MRAFKLVQIAIPEMRVMFDEERRKVQRGKRQERRVQVITKVIAP